MERVFSNSHKGAKKFSNDVTPLYQYPGQNISPGGNPGEKKRKIWQNLSPVRKTLPPVKQK